jgi:5'(3')-deoxyribonucleotidase
MKCLLDLDGVLVDFLTGACRLHNQPNPYTDPNFHEFDFVHKFFDRDGNQMTQNLFYYPMNMYWWMDLPWTSDGKEILSTLESHFGKENICIISSPCLTPGCMEGKLEWIKRKIPDYKRRFLFGPRKEFCAGPNTVLVDDRSENTLAFMANGGRTILVPRQWNCLHNQTYIGSVKFITNSLQLLSQRLGYQ